MGQDRKADLRKRRRDQGFKPLEVWLHQDIISKLDQLKSEEIPSRDAVIMALIEDTLDLKRPVQSRDQPMLV